MASDNNVIQTLRCLQWSNHNRKNVLKKKKTRKSTGKISVWPIKMNHFVRAFTYNII